METEQQELPPYIVPPCPRDPDILYRDEHVLLVNKPEWLLTVPGRHPLNRDCLINRLQQDHPSATIVHRLDLDTSGILVVPLTRSAHRHISRQFQERRVDKSYQAIVYGPLKQSSGTIDLPIARDWSNRPRQIICTERGKHALTHFTVLEQSTPERSRVLLKPVTGRSHQLRIHLASIGHPILGCDMYAHERALAMSDRLLLHAHRLSLEHPVTGELLSGEAPLPF